MSDRDLTLTGGLSVSGDITVTEKVVSGSISTSGKTVQTMGGNITISGGLPNYPGPYEVTPTTETQTLSTRGQITVHDITINPIPSNYGLITWDGSILTVS